MKYDHPFLFYLAAILPILFLVYRIKFSSYLLVPYSPLQYNKPSKKWNWKYLKYILESVLIGCLLLAMAGPHKTIERDKVIEEGIDIALALDISASMQAADFPPNRLEFLKQITSSFIKKNEGNRIGIFIFAADTFTQTPLTTDYSILQELLQGINFYTIDHNESGGTAIGDALLSASDALIRNKVPKRDQAIILITDGENTDGVDPILAAKYVKDNNIRLYIVGVAGEEPIKVYVNNTPYLTPSGEVLVTSLDDTQLKEIAKTGNGKYYRAKGSTVLEEIFNELTLLERAPIEVRKLYSKIEYSYLFGIPLLVLFLLWLSIDFFLIRRPMR